MTWDGLVQRNGKYCSIRRTEYPEFQNGIFGRMENAPAFTRFAFGASQAGNTGADSQLSLDGHNRDRPQLSVLKRCPA